jgi:hypothetical protein
MAASDWRTEVTNRPFYDVTATYPDPDDPTKTVSALPGGNATTNLKAFRAAILAASKSLPPNVPGENYSRGGMVFVPFGNYDLSGPLLINRRIVLQGTQGWGRAAAGAAYPGSVLRFPAGSKGIHVLYPNFNGSLSAIDRGDFTVIRDIAVTCYSTTSDVANAHGIELNSIAAIQNCSVTGFGGNGIHIYAYEKVATDPTKDGNADGWQILNCFIQDNQGHGLYVEGTTANAGVATAVSVVRSGLNKDNRWGFYDRSKTGNTYIGCSAAQNGQLTQGTAGPPSVNPNTNSGNYRSEDNAGSGDLNRSMFIRCYSEGYRRSVFVRSTTVLGLANNNAEVPEGGQQFVFGSGSGNVLQLSTKTALPGGATPRDAFVVTDTGVTKLGGPLDLFFREHSAGAAIGLNEGYGLIAVTASTATTAQLPSIVDAILGRTYTIKKVGAGNVSINAASGQSIDGAATYPLTTANASVTVAAAKSGSSYFWMVIAKV